MRGLDNLVGQADLKDFLRPKIELAKAGGNLPHLLFCGEKELGKESLRLKLPRNWEPGSHYFELEIF